MGNFRGKFYVKAIAAVVAAIFLHQQIAWAQGGAAPAAMPPAARVSENVGAGQVGTDVCDIDLPYNLAHRDEVYTGAREEKIIHLQDAHASLSAQYSLVNLLDVLAKNYDLEFIALEGTEGVIDTSLLKSFPDKDIREKTADLLMREGRMSAGEFFQITRDEKNIMLCGVEDNELYKENLDGFCQVIEQREPLVKMVKAFRGQIDALEEKVYSDELRTFIYRGRAHKNGTLNFSDYWREMSPFLEKFGIETGTLRDMPLLTQSIELERKIDFEKANTERGDLISDLTGRLEKDELKALVLESVNFKEQKVSPANFHKYLEELARENNISLSAYKNFSMFTEYISLYESVDIFNLYSEVESLEKTIRGKLYRNEDERELNKISVMTELLRGLYSIELSSRDFGFFEETREKYDAKKFAAFIKDKCAKHKVTIEKGYDLAEMLGGINSAANFYETAAKRDRLMIQNTLKRMKSEKKRVAALITGGYHTKGLTEIMKENKLSYLIISPKFEKDEERPYVAVLTGKKKPYEELLESGKYQIMAAAWNNPNDTPESQISKTEEIVALTRAINDMTQEDWENNGEEWKGSFCPGSSVEIFNEDKFKELIETVEGREIDGAVVTGYKGGEPRVALKLNEKSEIQRVEITEKHKRIWEKRTGNIMLHVNQVFSMTKLKTESDIAESVGNKIDNPTIDTEWQKRNMIIHPALVISEENINNTIDRMRPTVIGVGQDENAEQKRITEEIKRVLKIKGINEAELKDKIVKKFINAAMEELKRRNESNQTPNQDEPFVLTLEKIEKICQSLRDEADSSSVGQNPDDLRKKVERAFMEMGATEAFLKSGAVEKQIQLLMKMIEKKDEKSNPNEANSIFAKLVSKDEAYWNNVEEDIKGYQKEYNTTYVKTSKPSIFEQSELEQTEIDLVRVVKKEEKLGLVDNSLVDFFKKLKDMESDNVSTEAPDQVKTPPAEFEIKDHEIGSRAYPKSTKFVTNEPTQTQEDPIESKDIKKSFMEKIEAQLVRMTFTATIFTALMLIILRGVTHNRAKKEEEYAPLVVQKKESDEKSVDEADAVTVKKDNFIKSIPGKIVKFIKDKANLVIRHKNLIIMMFVSIGSIAAIANAESFGFVQTIERVSSTPLFATSTFGMVELMMVVGAVALTVWVFLSLGKGEIGAERRLPIIEILRKETCKLDIIVAGVFAYQTIIQYMADGAFTKGVFLFAIATAALIFSVWTFIKDGLLVKTAGVENRETKMIEGDLKSGAVVMTVTKKVEDVPVAEVTSRKKLLFVQSKNWLKSKFALAKKYKDLISALFVSSIIGLVSISQAYDGSIGLSPSSIMAMAVLSGCTIGALVFLIRSLDKTKKISDKKNASVEIPKIRNFKELKGYAGISIVTSAMTLLIGYFHKPLWQICLDLPMKHEILGSITVGAGLLTSAVVAGIAIWFTWITLDAAIPMGLKKAGSFVKGIFRFVKTYFSVFIGTVFAGTLWSTVARAVNNSANVVSIFDVTQGTKFSVIIRSIPRNVIVPFAIVMMTVITAVWIFSAIVKAVRLYRAQERGKVSEEEVGEIKKKQNRFNIQVFSNMALILISFFAANNVSLTMEYALVIIPFAILGLCVYSIYSAIHFVCKLVQDYRKPLTEQKKSERKNKKRSSKGEVKISLLTGMVFMFIVLAIGCITPKVNTKSVLDKSVAKTKMAETVGTQKMDDSKKMVPRTETEPKKKEIKICGNTPNVHDAACDVIILNPSYGAVQDEWPDEIYFDYWGDITGYEVEIIFTELGKRENTRIEIFLKNKKYINMSSGAVTPDKDGVVRWNPAAVEGWLFRKSMAKAKAKFIKNNAAISIKFRGMDAEEGEDHIEEIRFVRKEVNKSKGVSRSKLFTWAPIIALTSFITGSGIFNTALAGAAGLGWMNEIEAIAVSSPWGGLSLMCLLFGAMLAGAGAIAYIFTNLLNLFSSEMEGKTLLKVSLIWMVSTGAILGLLAKIGSIAIWVNRFFVGDMLMSSGLTTIGMSTLLIALFGTAMISAGLVMKGTHDVYFQNKKRAEVIFSSLGSAAGSGVLYVLARNWRLIGNALEVLVVGGPANIVFAVVITVGGSIGTVLFAVATLVAISKTWFKLGELSAERKRSGTALFTVIMLIFGIMFCWVPGVGASGEKPEDLPAVKYTEPRTPGNYVEPRVPGIYVEPRTPGTFSAAPDSVTPRTDVGTDEEIIPLTGWYPETYDDSQGIVDVYCGEDGILKIVADMRGQDDYRRQGEVYRNLDEATDFTGKKESFKVRVPEKYALNQENGVVPYMMDVNGNKQYADRVKITRAGEWVTVEMVPMPYGRTRLKGNAGRFKWTDPGFDPSLGITRVGIKFVIDEKSTDTFISENPDGTVKDGYIEVADIRIVPMEGVVHEAEWQNVYRDEPIVVPAVDAGTFVANSGVSLYLKTYERAIGTPDGVTAHYEETLNEFKKLASRGVKKARILLCIGSKNTSGIEFDDNDMPIGFKDFEGEDLSGEELAILDFANLIRIGTETDIEMALVLHNKDITEAHPGVFGDEEKRAALVALDKILLDGAKEMLEEDVWEYFEYGEALNEPDDAGTHSWYTQEFVKAENKMIRDDIGKPVTLGPAKREHIGNWLLSDSEMLKPGDMFQIHVYNDNLDELLAELRRNIGEFEWPEGVTICFGEAQGNIGSDSVISEAFPAAHRSGAKRIYFWRDNRLSPKYTVDEDEYQSTAQYMMSADYDTDVPDEVDDTELPIARAAVSDQTVDEGVEIIFNAGESTDEGGEIETFSWDFDDYDGIQEDAGTVTATHTYDEPGVYLVTLTVTDTAGNSGTDTLTITVNEAVVDDDTDVTNETDVDVTDETDEGVTDETDGDVTDKADDTDTNKDDVDKPGSTLDTSDGGCYIGTAWFNDKSDKSKDMKRENTPGAEVLAREGVGNTLFDKVINWWEGLKTSVKKHFNLVVMIMFGGALFSTIARAGEPGAFGEVTKQLFAVSTFGKVELAVASLSAAVAIVTMILAFCRINTIEDVSFQEKPVVKKIRMVNNVLLGVNIGMGIMKAARGGGFTAGVSLFCISTLLLVISLLMLKEKFVDAPLAGKLNKAQARRWNAIEYSRVKTPIKVQFWKVFEGAKKWIRSVKKRFDVFIMTLFGVVLSAAIASAKSGETFAEAWTFAEIIVGIIGGFAIAGTFLILLAVNYIIRRNYEERVKETEFKVALGLSEKMYADIVRNGHKNLLKEITSDVEIIHLEESVSREVMQEEFNEKTRGRRVVGAIVDPTVLEVINGIDGNDNSHSRNLDKSMRIIEDFIKTAKKEITPLMAPKAGFFKLKGLTQKAIKEDFDKLEKLTKKKTKEWDGKIQVLVRTLPAESLQLVDKGAYHVPVNKWHRAVVGENRVSIDAKRLAKGGGGLIVGSNRKYISVSAYDLADLRFIANAIKDLGVDKEKASQFIHVRLRNNNVRTREDLQKYMEKTGLSGYLYPKNVDIVSEQEEKDMTLEKILFKVKHMFSGAMISVSNDQIFVGNTRDLNLSSADKITLSREKAPKFVQMRGEGIVSQLLLALVEFSAREKIPASLGKITLDPNKTGLKIYIYVPKIKKADYDAILDVIKNYEKMMMSV
ncbi:MAG: PKD domain-containing protein [Candidatus Omnitrophica bacterium]|nr:PKD domain-containing protein [Candidatus Omnitrophota bacterium]